MAKNVWTHDLSMLEEAFTDANEILAQIETSVHKGLEVTDAKAVQKLCVLMSARYSQAAASLYTIIRSQEERENLRKIKELK